MNKFYLRQTVPYKITDLIKNLLYFFRYPESKSVKTTEKNISDAIGTKYSILTSSMREGLTSVLYYFRKKYPKKNQIIIPEYTFISNYTSAIKNKFKIIMTPINKDTLEIDFRYIEKNINKNTLGMIITHMHGKVYEMEKLLKIIKKYNLILFEDCAHVFGNKYKNKVAGSFGIGFFSFGSGKNITCFGGGSVCTNNKNLYIYLKNRQIASNSIKKDLTILFKSIIFTLASNPTLGYLFVKPILGFKNLLKHQIKINLNIKTGNIKTKLYTPSSLQRSFLNYQITIMKDKLQEMQEKRHKIAEKYDRYFKKKKMDIFNNYCFQYPIYNDNKKFIIKGWKNNIDIQKDYCVFLPNLLKSYKKTDSYFKNLYYLPVNFHINILDIDAYLRRIFNK